MQQTNSTCVSVFKGGEISREGYTAIWKILIERMVGDPHVLARKEP